MAKNHKSKKFARLSPIITISLVTIVFLGMWSIRLNVSQPALINQIESDDNQIDVYFTPRTLELNPGESQIVKINITARDNPVLGSVIELSYDPAKLKISDVANGSFFPDTIEPVKNGKGLVSFGFGLPFNSVTGNTGTGNIAMFKVIAVESGTLVVDFTDNTEIIPSNQVTEDIAIASNSLNITVLPLEKSPSPTLLITTPAPLPSIPPSQKSSPPPVRSSPPVPPSLTVATPSPSQYNRVYEPLTGTPFDKTVDNYDARGVNVAVEDVKITPLPTLKPTIFTTIGNYFRKVIGI